MEREFARWDDIDVHFRDRVLTSGGHGFAAMSRKRLLEILQARCAELGVTVHFRTAAPDVEELRRTHDLVVACDGVNSAIRSRYADEFGASVDVRHCKYMWLGTDKVFDAFKFYIRETPHGVMQIHGYPYDRTGSTFIIEMNDDVWKRAGFDAFADAPFAPGESDEKSAAVITELFADVLDGHEVLLNNSKWLNFTTVRNERWRHGNVVLIGDAAHTAHFSIGSGTKLAMEDALALVACLHENAGRRERAGRLRAGTPPGRAVDPARRAGQPRVVREPRPVHRPGPGAVRVQHHDPQPPRHLRQPAAARPRVRRRGRRLVRRARAARAATAPARSARRCSSRSGCASSNSPNRVVVSPMDMYKAVDGCPTEFHLVHLGGKALGGAGLVMTEMVCVSDVGRITPGCTGIYTDEHADELGSGIVDFVHRESPAQIGIQLGHSGRKGSTRLMWEGMDQPLPDGNWQLVAPSPLPYQPGVSQVPAEASTADLDAIKDEFVAGDAA